MFNQAVGLLVFQMIEWRSSFVQATSHFRSDVILFFLIIKAHKVAF